MQPLDADPYVSSCITVQDEVNAIVQTATSKIAGAMPGKPRRDEPSVQLTRLKYLFLQLERKGHPDWKDANGDRLAGVSQAEVARRTGLTATYVNAIRNPETRRNMDVGSAILAQVCDRVGLNVGFFYDKYEGERPFEVYLLANFREGKHVDQAVKTAVAGAVQGSEARLRAEMVAMYSGLKSEMDSQRGLVAAAEDELASLKTRLRTVQAERDDAVAELAKRQRAIKSR